MQEDNKTYPWYAKQLRISLATAKRKGKLELRKMLKERETEFKTRLSPLIAKVYQKGKENLGKNQDSNVFFNLDESQVNEDTRKVGIDLLNKTLRRLSTIVEGDDMPVYQRSCVLLGIAKMILGVR